MIKRVPVNTIEDDESFPYDFRNWNYPEELLRSTLYSAWWTEIDDDNNETALLMDYDGFIEWYNANIDEWLTLDDGDDEAFTAEEYLPYHIGRTICPVKEVIP